MVGSISEIADGQVFSSRLRVRLCLGTALALTASILADPAFAACSATAPASGQTVDCDGDSTTGVIADTASAVTVNIASAATLIPASGQAINLGAGAQINVGAGSTVGNDAIENNYAIRIGDGSTVTIDGKVQGRGGITGPGTDSSTNFNGFSNAHIIVHQGGEVVTSGTGFNGALNGRAGGNTYTIDGTVRDANASEGILVGDNDILNLGATGKIISITGNSANPIYGSGKNNVTVTTAAGSLIELHGLGQGISLGKNADVTLGGTIRSYGDTYPNANSAGGTGVQVDSGSTVRLLASAQIVTGNTAGLSNQGAGGNGISTFSTTGPSNSKIFIDGLIDTQRALGIFSGVGDSITVGATGRITTRSTSSAISGTLNTTTAANTFDLDISGTVEQLGTARALFLTASRATGESVETAAHATITVREGGTLYAAANLAYGQDDGFGTYPEIIDNFVVAGRVARGNAGTVINLNDGADRITFLTTYSLTGDVDGGSDAGGPSDPTETDTFALDGATGTSAVFNFGANKILNFEAGEKLGAGSWTLTGDTAGLKGIFSVNQGTLFVNGIMSQTGAAVANGASLGGTGAFGGAVTVANGGSLLGTGGADLGMASLVLNDTSLVKVGLGAPGNAALFNVGGALTLDGKLIVTDAGGFAFGNYRLFDYGGALTDNGLTIQSLPGGYNPGDWSLDTSTSGQVTLVVAQGDGSQYWDGGNMSPGGVDNGRGGFGTWNASSTNWTNQAGTINAPWAGGIANFGPCPADACVNGGGTSAAYTVTVDVAGVSAGGIRTLAVPVTLAGGAITLADDARIDVVQPTSSDTDTLNASADFHALGDLTKGGLGSFFFTGPVDIDGALTVEQGVMMADAAAASLDVTGAISVGGTGADPFPTRLLATGGAAITSAGGSVGGDAGTAGSIYIQRGGTWDAGANTIEVGASGTGVLRVYSSLVSAVSEITADEIVLGRNAGGNGKLQIWGDDSDGIVTASKVWGGLGGGSVEFDNRTSGADYIFSPILGGNLSTSFLSGSTTLQGTNDYSGATLVNGGALILDGASLTKTNVTVQKGVLAGSGTIGGAAGGAVSFAATNTTLIGQSGALLTMGSLALGAQTLLDVRLGAPSDDALFDVTGALTLDGNLAVTDAGGFGYGSYRLVDYGGALTDNGLTIQSLPSGYNPGDWLIDTGTSGEVTLIVAQGDGAQYWDGGNMSPGGVDNGRGGTGIWNAANTNWTNQAGTINAPWAGGQATFGSVVGAASVAVVGEQSVSAMRFLAPVGGSTGYVFTPGPAGALAIAGGQTAFDVAGDAGGAVTEADIGVEIRGVGGILKTGNGDLALSAANTYAGATRIESGLIVANVTGALSGGPVTIAGGGLSFAGSGTGAGALVIANQSSDGDGGLSFLTGTSAGSAAITNSGLVRFFGTANAADATIVNQSGGIVDASGRDGIGEFNIGSLSGAGTVRLGDQALALGALGGNDTISGVIENGPAAIDGIGQLVKTGGGTLTLTGLNTYTGFTTVREGTLLVDGAVAGDIGVYGGALGGSGTIAGDVTVLGGTSLLGRAGSDLAMGSLVLNDTSLVSASLGASSNAALFDIDTDLTLDGRLIVTDAGGFTLGNYRLFDYGGTLANNGLVIQSLPSGFNPGDWAIDTDTSGEVTLIVAQSTGTQYWDGANMAPGSITNGRGGTGTWNAANTNWTNQAGTINAPWASQNAVFAAAGSATVTVVGTQGFTGLEFLSGGDYSFVAGSGGQLRADGLGQIVLDQNTGASTRVSIAAPLSGSGGIVKGGAGTLVLSGANSYSGGTLVGGGVLQVASDAALGALSGDITLDGGTLRLDGEMNSARDFTIDAGGGTLDTGANAVTLSGALTGSGALTRLGSSKLTYSGDGSAYDGTFTLSGGTLALTGTLGGTLRLGDGARLAGSGTVEELLVQAGGIVTPGASIGTLHASGDVTFQAGSFYDLELDADGSSDRLDVDGTVTLAGGTVRVIALDPYTDYTDGTRYTFLTADDGLTGTFAGLSEDSAFLDFALGYGAKAAYVDVAQVRSFPDVALTFDQGEAALALAAFERTPGSDSLAVYNRILLLDASGARSAFDFSSGEIYAAALGAAVRQAAADARQLLGQAQAGSNEGWSLRGAIDGQDGRVSADGNGARITHDRIGGTLGLDYRAAGNRWAAGLGAGYWNGNVDLPARTSHADTEGWRLGGYLRAGAGGAGFSATVAGAYAGGKARVERDIALGSLARTAAARPDLDSWTLAGEGRYGLALGKQWAAGPIVRVTYAGGSLGRFAESGADSLDLTGGSGNGDHRTLYGGGVFAHWTGEGGGIDLTALYVRGGDDPAEVVLAMAGAPGDPFRVRSARGSEAHADLGASAHYRVAAAIDLGVTLNAVLAGAERTIAAQAAVKWMF